MPRCPKHRKVAKLLHETRLVVDKDVTVTLDKTEANVRRDAIVIGPHLKQRSQIVQRFQTFEEPYR